MKLKYITIFFFIALIILAPSLSLAQEEQIDTTEEYAKFLQKPETFGLGGFFSIADKVGWGFVKAFEIMTTNFSSFITGWVLRLSTSFLEWTVNPCIESITGQQFVIQGVLITRSIANLVLIGILLIISIATIIGIESYGIRKALPMLIGVALLINFSSVITGIVIDVGQVPLEFFTEKAFPPDFSIGEAFQKSLHLSAISPGFFKDFTTLSALGNFAVSLITIAIGLAASFMFFKLGILLLLRYVAFWILTILAPFVFAISVFPSTRKYLIKWFMHLLIKYFLVEGKTLIAKTKGAKIVKIQKATYLRRSKIPNLKNIKDAANPIAIVIRETAKFPKALKVVKSLKKPGLIALK